MLRNDKANRLLIEAIGQKNTDVEYTDTPFSQSYYENFRKNEQKIKKSQMSREVLSEADRVWMD